MNLYTRLTVAEKREQLSTPTELDAKDICFLWDAIADEDEKVPLSQDYGEIIVVRGKDGKQKNIVRVAEDTKFRHIYSPVEETEQHAPLAEAEVHS